jgi:hypothetical protein
VAAANWFRYVYHAHLAGSKSVRQLYRLVKQQRVCRMIDVGISDVAAAAIRIEIAQRYAGQQTVAYTGVDWFEARQSPIDALSLKDAYRALRPTGANVRLVPGEPGRSLASVANAHQNTDLIVIGHLVSESDLAPAWFYVPRMLHERTVILRESLDAAACPVFTALTRSEVLARASGDGRRRVA